MIQIKVQCSSDQINKIDLKGHAGYDEIGKDLVCAAVSSIMFGLLNALDEMSNENVKMSVDSKISIEALNADSKTQIILNTGLVQLRTVEESYPDFIKIQIQEV